MTRAIVLSNTIDLDESNFYERQKELKEPMVLFVNGRECVKSFKIAANSMEHFKDMIKNGIFDTFDLPEEHYIRIDEAYFVGVGPQKNKRGGRNG